MVCEFARMFQRRQCGYVRAIGELKGSVNGLQISSIGRVNRIEVCLL